MKLYTSFRAKIAGLFVTVFTLFAVNVFADTHTTAQSGDFSTGTTWVGGIAPIATDDAIILSGHVVSIPNGGSGGINNITINAGGYVQIGNKTLSISGNLVLNGAITAIHNNADVIITGATSTMDGTGYIDLSMSTKNSFTVQAGASLTFLSTTDVLFTACSIVIDNNVTVTNNGIVTISSGVVGNNAASTWTNTANSTLKCGSTILATGILNASASGNTVEFYSVAAINVKLPTSSQFYHLNISGTGAKTLVGAINVDGNLTITGLLDVSATNYKINLDGNWINNNTFTEQNGEVELDGSGTQTITNTFGETFYKLTINKATGSVVLDTNVIVSNNLTMLQGNIISTSSARLTLGTNTGVANEGTLTYTAGTIIGEFERWCSQTVVTYLFPIGTTSNYLPVSTNFISFTGTGGSLIVKFIESAPGNAGFSFVDGAVTLYNPFVEGYWDLTKANSLGSNNYNIELTGNGFSSFTITANTRIATRANAGSNWSANGTHGSVSGNKISRTGINTMSAQFAFADTTNCSGPSTSAISGNSSVCANAASEPYSVTNTPGSTYTWTITGGTADPNPASGQGTNSITVNWGATGMVGQVKVVERNACTQGFPVTLDVNIHAITPSSITGKEYVGENTDGVTYSVTNQPGYTYTWTITGGDNDPNPNTGQGTNSITVNWGAYGSGNVQVIANNTICGNSSTPVNLPINIYNIIESIISGPWNNTATWDCSCIPQTYESARVNSTHTVTLNGADRTIKNFIITNGGILSAGNKALNISGDFTINGDYTSSAAVNLNLTGVDTKIEGTGRIGIGGFAVTVNIQNGSKTILSGSSFSIINGNANIESNNTVTNNGNITIAGNLEGAASTIWINKESSQLHVGGTLFNVGALSALFNGNLVEYTGTIAQNIKQPINSGQYYNLTLSGSNTKTLSASILVSGNFVSNTTFAHNNKEVTFNGSTNQTISGTTTPTFYDLSVNKSGGTLTLNTNATIVDLLNFSNGTLDINSNMLTVSNSSVNAISRTSGHIISEQTNNSSKLKWYINNITGSHIFPFGKADGTYIPFTLNLTAGTIGNVTVSTYPTATDNTPFPSTPDAVTNLDPTDGFGFNNSPNVVDRFWQIDKDGASGTATLTFTASSSEVGTITNLMAQRWNSSTSIWEQPLAGQTNTATTVTVPDVTTFSPWALSGNNSPLPINLISFSATLNNNKVDLKWSTSAEINNDYFSIERSTNGISFEVIEKVKGQGNSNSLTNYIEIDSNPLHGVSYYRLRQTDFDGKNTVSEIVAVDISKLETLPLSFEIYPNPISQYETPTIKISEFESQKEVLVVVRDIIGQELYSKVIMTDFSGNSITAIDIENRLPAGTYLIIGTSVNQIFNKYLIIK